MAFEVEGTLYRLFQTEQKSASFSAREFVLEIPDGNYPQFIKFQAVQDRCAMLDNYREGERIKVSFDLRGREWQGKFLTNLNAWRIERGGAVENSSSAAESEKFPAAENFPNYSDAPPATNTGNFEDLPF
jgi:single-strand DNA-binding protein